MIEAVVAGVGGLLVGIVAAYMFVAQSKKSKASIAGWTAEFFIPYELLKPLLNVPPKAGASWRANFYRMDYDDGHVTGWNWAPVGRSFHEYQKFGTLVFE